VRKYALSLITVHTLGLHDFTELFEDQRHISKKNMIVYNNWLKHKFVKFYQYTVSRD